MIPDPIDFLSKQSIHNCIKQVSYPYQISYIPKSILKSKTIAQEINQSSFTNFFSSCKTKFYKHIVLVLQLLSFNIDNKKTDEQTSLKEVMK